MLMLHAPKTHRELLSAEYDLEYGTYYVTVQYCVVCGEYLGINYPSECCPPWDNKNCKPRT